MAKTIGIISIKGGVGKTTSAVNLGAALASLGKKVLLVDADFSSPSAGLHLGIANPKKTLHHVFQGKITAYEAIHSYTSNFDLLPSSLGAGKVNPYLLKEKISGLKKLYDYIIIDSAPTLNDDMLATMVASDELLVVTSPDYPTLSATLNAVKIAKQRRTPIAGLILNKVRGRRFELTLSEIEEASGVPVVCTIKDDVSVPSSIANTKPTPMHRPWASSSRSYRKLALKMSGFENKNKLMRLIGSLNLNRVKNYLP